MAGSWTHTCCAGVDSDTTQPWRGSSLPLGCAATPTSDSHALNLAPASQSSGSKLPRHGG
ncbi:hypothetical protein FHK92_03450 [Pseudomonas brassicacearum subsp. neoaurantiaca]|uniref:Uncharacterized protein n=1 Tax=Pseudomonas brassicacearum subsp. neoaurantiaca TaxID=494916 RepID=A0A7V8UA95_9PSED|nr:hypothetical protein [Pseudomonas brassicacearum subsp. neoaurantiaca]